MTRATLPERTGIPPVLTVAQPRKAFAVDVRRHLPLLFFQAYLLISLAVLAFGPADLVIENPWKFYPFVLLGQVAIWVGYSLGAKVRPCGYAGRLSVPTLLKFSIVVALALIPSTLMHRNHAGISLSRALADPGAAYAARAQAIADRTEAPIISVMRAVCGPVTGLLLPLGMLYRSRTSDMWRWLWLAALFGGIAESLYVGAAKAMFDVILVTPWFLWLRQQLVAEQTHAEPVYKKKRAQRSQVFRRRAAVVVTLVLIVAGINYFSHSRQSRYGLSGNSYPPYTTEWSEDLYGISIPAKVEYPIYMFSRYLAHGYVGLSECLELPFQPCYGLGHSKFLLRYGGALLGDSEGFQQRAYPFHLEAVTGYDARNYWHTIYPWLASDLSFPGAIVAIGVLAFLLARVWNDTLIAKNPIAAALLGQMILLFYYIPASNIRMMFSEEFMTFWGLLAAWVLTKRVRTHRPVGR